MNIRLLLLIGIIAFGVDGGLARGQILHATGDLPSFEVATIKPWQKPPSPPPSDGTTAPPKPVKVAPVGGAGEPTDRVHMILPVSLLIASAYNVPVGSEGRLVQGGPEWIGNDQYEIQAKIEDSLFAAMQKMTPAQQREQVALMEQSLLAERFRMKVHFETREMPDYALVVAKGGPKLTAANAGEVSKISMASAEQGRELTAVAVTLDQFAVSPFLTGSGDGRLVVNQTGLPGAYDFVLKWTPELAGDSPSFFTAIQEQLGLRLTPSKAQTEVLVIDHIEPPSAN